MSNNSNNLALSDLNPGTYVLINLISRADESKNIQVIGKILHRYNNSTFDVRFNNSINVNEYKINISVNKRYHDALYQGNDIDYLYICNIFINQIVQVVTVGNSSNFYGIKESDIKIGDYVKIRVLLKDSTFDFRTVKIRDIIPDTEGHSSFVFDFLYNNGENNNIVYSYRGIPVLKATSIKGIIDYHRPTENNLLSYTLLDVMRNYLGKGIIRKIEDVYTKKSNRITCYRIITRNKGRFGPGKWSMNCLDENEHNCHCIPAFTQYNGITKTRPLRRYNDKYNDEAITFHTDHAALLDYNNNYTGTLYRPDKSNNPLIFPPDQTSLIYGMVERNSENKLYYNIWTIVTPQFLLFWTLIMYGDDNPSTSNLTPDMIKERLTLRTEQSVLDNDQLTDRERYNQLFRLSPFYMCSDLNMYPTFFNDMYTIITTYSMSQFKELYMAAKHEYENIGIFSKDIYVPIFLLGNIAWYLPIVH